MHCSLEFEADFLDHTQHCNQHVEDDLDLLAEVQEIP